MTSPKTCLQAPVSAAKSALGIEVKFWLDKPFILKYFSIVVFPTSS
jgi:hypothetical protein